MLKDDPPPGTKVRMLRDVGLAKAQSTATLVRALGLYKVELPEDQFEIEYRGEYVIVQRQDIE
jgi:hypothetical protein